MPFLVPSHPYANLPARAFWKTGVAQEHPTSLQGLYTKKFAIAADAQIAAAGSCFAQHISRQLKRRGFAFLDLEPPPPELPERLHQAYGFSTYSARYGNIYSVRQLLQLAQEAAGWRSPENWIWEKNGRFVDALRPSVEPEGLDSPKEVMEHRRYHLASVKKMFERLDVFFFTFGLTEMWVHQPSGTVVPTAPGTVAGIFDANVYAFRTARHAEILRDFDQFQSVLKHLRGGRPFHVLLTVSPVPLTATASGEHVLRASVEGKATLRSVAGELSAEQEHIDYFPSFEIVTNPTFRSRAFAENFRSVREEVIDQVMATFFAEHASAEPPIPNAVATDDAAATVADPCGEKAGEAIPEGERRDSDLACEDMILESFAPQT